MFRILSLIKPAPFKFIHPIPAFNFGSEVYAKNRSKTAVTKSYQKKIDLSAQKEKLRLGLESPESITIEPADHAIPEKAPVKPIRKETPRKSDKDREGKTFTRRKESTQTEAATPEAVTAEALQSNSVTREKIISGKFLKAKTKEDVLRLYDKHALSIKPIHLSIGVFQIIKLVKMEQKLEALTEQPSKNDNNKKKEKEKELSIWNNMHFLEVFTCTVSNIESMNPDSLIRLLATINLKKSGRPELKLLYDKITAWLVEEQNVLLFDKIQLIKLFIYFARLASRDYYHNQHNTQLYRLMTGKLRNYLSDYRTNNILQIYRSCMKLRHSDPKLFTALNAQIRRRIKYVEVKDLIPCCATNLACQNEDGEKFIRTTFLHLIKTRQFERLRLKDSINLLFLLGELKTVKVESAFRRELDIITDDAIKKVINKQIKFLSSQTEVRETKRGDYSISELNERKIRTVKLANFDSLLRALILLDRPDEKVIELIMALIKNDYAMSKKEALAIVTFAVKYKLHHNSIASLKTFFFIVYNTFAKLEKKLIRVTSDEVNSLHHVLSTVLETGDEYVEQATKYSGFAMNFGLTIRKFLHIHIQGNYKLSPYMLIREYMFLLRNREIRVSRDKKFDVMDFYVRSVRKNLLQPLLIYSHEEEQVPEDLRLKLDEKQMGNIVNSLWILSGLFSRDYPIIEDMALFQEYAKVLSQHFVPKNLDKDLLDKLIEIKTLFSFSMTGNPFSSFLDSPEMDELIAARMQSIKEGVEKRRRNVRTEVERMLNEALEQETLQVEHCVLLKENIVADLLVTYKNRRYVVVIYTHPEDAKTAKLNKALTSPNVKRIMNSPLKMRVLMYKSYRPMFLNIKMWMNMSEGQKKKEIEEFFSKSSA